MSFKKPPSVIVALDLPLQKASKLARELEKAEGKIAAYKVSSLQAIEAGLKAVVAELRIATDMPIIYDHQKGCTDIPEIVEQQVNAVASAGASSFIAVPLGAGPRSMESFVNACKKNNVLPVVLLEMTHPEANFYLKEDTPKKVFEKAIELGVEYFVCPGNKPEKIQEYKNWNKNIKIMSPGIGAQGGSARDAAKAGTDYLIVGRNVYQSENPAAEVERIYKEALEGFKQRK